MSDQCSYSHYNGPIISKARSALLPASQDFSACALVNDFIDPGKVEECHFLLPVHRRLWTYWCKQRGALELPLSGRIDALAFFPVLGSILLLEPNDDGDDFRFRVYGSHVAGRANMDLTGKWLSEAKAMPATSARLFTLQYAALMKERCPIYSEHDAPLQVSTITRWCRLILPFCDENGSIDRILVGNVAVNRIMQNKGPA